MNLVNAIGSGLSAFVQFLTVLSVLASVLFVAGVAVETFLTKEAVR